MMLTQEQWSKEFLALCAARGYEGEVISRPTDVEVRVRCPNGAAPPSFNFDFSYGTYYTQEKLLSEAPADVLRHFRDVLFGANLALVSIKEWYGCEHVTNLEREWVEPGDRGAVTQ